MKNPVGLKCGSCGRSQEFQVAEDLDDTVILSCQSCGKPITTVGKVHAQVAQEAIGLGADDLSDDHVPLGGPPFGETT